MGHNTVVRGGAGSYFEQPQMSQANGMVGGAPFAVNFTLNEVSFADPYGSINFPDPFPAEYTAGPPSPSYVFQLPVSAGGFFAPDFHVGTMSTWNTVVEHQFGSNWLASIGYVGNAGYHLSSNQQGREAVNPAVYIPGVGSNGQPNSTEGNTRKRRINPNFSTANLYPSTYNSRYDSLQMNMEKRFSHGLSLVANYTWEKTLDDFPAGGAVTDPFDMRDDWGVSKDNVSNVFHLSEVWQIRHLDLHGFAGGLANGWEITSIATWLGGFPFSVFSGLDNSFCGVGEDRADFTGANYRQAVLSGQSHAQMINQYFKTSLFTANAIGTFGDAGKNILTGPRSFNTDFAVIKDTAINESTKVQFRAEFFNVFNNVNFSGPSNSTTSGNFGAITGAGSPRILQFALKFLF
jgi:hypothetical protein